MKYLICCIKTSDSHTHEHQLSFSNELEAGFYITPEIMTREAVSYLPTSNESNQNKMRKRLSEFIRRNKQQFVCASGTTREIQ